MKLSSQIKPISYEKTQQTMGLLKILALGMRQVEEVDIVPANEAIKLARKRREIS